MKQGQYYYHITNLRESSPRETRRRVPGDRESSCGRELAVQSASETGMRDQQEPPIILCPTLLGEPCFSTSVHPSQMAAAH